MVDVRMMRMAPHNKKLLSESGQDPRPHEPHPTRMATASPTHARTGISYIQHGTMAVDPPAL